MHTENNTPECLFGVKSLSALLNGEYSYLGRDGDSYYFVFNRDGNYLIKKIETLDDSCISDRMWEDFDAHDAWVDAVRNGDTDESYDSRQQDIDIWDEMDSTDYFNCPSKVIEILYNLGLRSDPDYASDNGYYLDECQTWTANSDVLDNIYRRLDTSVEFNRDLRDDIERKFGVNQIEFLQAEPIR